jgi:hypothetical protein
MLIHAIPACTLETQEIIGVRHDFGGVQELSLRAGGRGSNPATPTDKTSEKLEGAWFVQLRDTTDNPNSPK